MNSLPLPAPIEAYFASEHRPEHMASCFTADAVMMDDGHTYSGVEAITTFMEAAAARYRATSTPLSIQQEGSHYIVRATVRGTFAGSPIDLSYRFQLAGDLIASLEITA